VRNADGKTLSFVHQEARVLSLADAR